MEMTSQQTIGEGLGDGVDIFEIQIHELFIIAFPNKNILAVVAAVVDVVIGVVEQWGRACRLVI